MIDRVVMTSDVAHAIEVLGGAILALFILYILWDLAAQGRRH